MSYPHSSQQQQNNTRAPTTVQTPYFCYLGNFHAPVFLEGGQEKIYGMRPLNHQYL